VTARGCSGSVARVPKSAQPSLNRQLRRWLAAELRRLRPEIAASARRADANRYRKHFTAFAHACLLIFHGLSGLDSLRQSFAAVAACRGLMDLADLTDADDPSAEGVGVSFSNYASANTSRPAAFLAGIIPYLVGRVRDSGQAAQAGLPADLHLFDSTFLRLSLVLSPWLPNAGGSDVPGVRLHVGYTPFLDLPETFLITDTRTGDRQAFDQVVLDDPSRLASLKGQTVAFDLGFYGHARFARLRQGQVHWVTRLHPQASYQLEENRPVQLPLPGLYPGRIQVQSDQRITLGSANNPDGATLSGLRLVVAQVDPLPKAARRGAKSVVYKIITDRWDLAAADVIQLYLWRWGIELFLRWLKSHVHLPRLLGYSRNAVELTVWLAIMTHLLSVLAAFALGRSRRSPALLRQLAWALPHLGEDWDEPPAPAAVQLALPENEALPRGPPSPTANTIWTFVSTGYTYYVSDSIEPSPQPSPSGEREPRVARVR